MSTISWWGYRTGISHKKIENIESKLMWIRHLKADLEGIGRANFEEAIAEVEASIAAEAVAT